MEDLLVRLGLGILSEIAIAVPALGMTLMWTSGRVLNLAFSEVLTLGAFISLTLWHLVPVPAAIALTTLVTGLCSMLMYALVFQWLKQRETFVSLIASLGIALLLNNLIIAIWGTKIGRFDLPDTVLRAVQFVPVRLTPLLEVLAVLAILTMALVALLIYRSDFVLQARGLATRRSGRGDGHSGTARDACDLGFGRGAWRAWRHGHWDECDRVPVRGRQPVAHHRRGGPAWRAWQSGRRGLGRSDRRDRR